MKVLADFLPIIVFFAVYQIYGAVVSKDEAMFAATIAIMVVMTIQIAVQWLRTRTVNRIMLISGVLVLVFGGITLMLRDALFIQWKVTILNWLLAIGFLASHFIGRQTLIEKLLGESIELPQLIWRRLNLLWVGNFALIGAINLYVVYNFSEATWVTFKFYGLLGLTLVMAVIQGIYISRHLTEAPDKGSSQ
jgi:intracellular septation protein